MSPSTSPERGPAGSDKPLLGCVLCDIVAGRRPARLVAADETTLVLLDHAPLAPGHCLVVPRRHATTMPDLAPGEAGQLAEWARRLAEVMPTALDVDGCLVAINVVVSQSVPHVHVHVVPRRHRDWLLARLILRLPFHFMRLARAAVRRAGSEAPDRASRQDRIATGLRQALEAAGYAAAPGLETLPASGFQGGAS